jgi:predicted transcriptional regulator
MQPKSRIDIWIQYEANKLKIMETLQVTPMTRNELMQHTKLTKMQVHNIIKNLHSYGYIKVVKNDTVVCRVSGRTMRRYTYTTKKYNPKDLSGMKERSEAAKRPKDKSTPRKKYDMTLRESQIKKEEMYDSTDKAVIKVNEYTTIYLNSKRPLSDYSWQRKRKHTVVSIGSGMDMFGTWA